MMWKNYKMKALLALVIVLVIYIILILGCGGFALQGCFWYFVCLLSVTAHSIEIIKYKFIILSKSKNVYIMGKIEKIN